MAKYNKAVKKEKYRKLGEREMTNISSCFSYLKTLGLKQTDYKACVLFRMGVKLGLSINPLNAELTLRLLMSYIYIYIYIWSAYS